MSRKDILQTLVGAFVTLVLTFIAWESSRWSTSFDELSKSVISLNTKLEVWITEVKGTNTSFTEKLADHETRLKDQDLRLRELEKKK